MAHEPVPHDVPSPDKRKMADNPHKLTVMQLCAPPVFRNGTFADCLNVFAGEPLNRSGEKLFNLILGFHSFRAPT